MFLLTRKQCYADPRVAQTCNYNKMLLIATKRYKTLPSSRLLALFTYEIKKKKHTDKINEECWALRRKVLQLCTEIYKCSFREQHAMNADIQRKYIKTSTLFGGL